MNGIQSIWSEKKINQSKAWNWNLCYFKLLRSIFIKQYLLSNFNFHHILCQARTFVTNRLTGCIWDWLGKLPKFNEKRNNETFITPAMVFISKWTGMVRGTYINQGGWKAVELCVMFVINLPHFTFNLVSLLFVF